MYDVVHRERARMKAFAEQIRDGRRCGCRGERITDVINVGIGGFGKGPARRLARAARRQPRDPSSLPLERRRRAPGAHARLLPSALDLDRRLVEELHHA